MVVKQALDTLAMPVRRQDHRLARPARLRAHRSRPRQKQVWTFAKALAYELARRNPALITAEYSKAKRPKGACSSTTTRTGGAARSRRSTRSARADRTVSTP
jgi:bifunctional non-homologous end joining protein LigD